MDSLIVTRASASHDILDAPSYGLIAISDTKAEEILKNLRAFRPLNDTTFDNLAAIERYVTLTQWSNDERAEEFLEEYTATVDGIGQHPSIGVATEDELAEDHTTVEDVLLECEDRRFGKGERLCIREDRVYFEGYQSYSDVEISTRALHKPMFQYVAGQIDRETLIDRLNE